MRGFVLRRFFFRLKIFSDCTLEPEGPLLLLWHRTNGLLVLNRKRCKHAFNSIDIPFQMTDAPFKLNWILMCIPIFVMLCNMAESKINRRLWNVSSIVVMKNPSLTPLYPTTRRAKWGIKYTICLSAFILGNPQHVMPCKDLLYCYRKNCKQEQRFGK